LTARLAVAYVSGVQGAGVAATVKHYVGNDSETERRTYDARIDEGTLRELYLAPFEAAVVDAGAMVVMAAYNSVNGATMTANAPLLRGVLKGEWKFPGVVVSDWSAATSTVASAAGGLDLVMPGPDGPWGDKLVAAVRDGRVDEADVDDKVGRLFALGAWLGALNGHDGHHPSAPHSALVDATLVREVATRSFVLLKNERRVLPIRPGSVDTIALIGPNAVEPLLQGGGSIRVLGVTRPPLAEALADATDAHVSVHAGALTAATVASPAAGTVRDPVSGKAGARVEIRGADGEVLYDSPRVGTVLTWWDGLPNDAQLHGVDYVMRTRYRPQVDGVHLVGAAGVGRTRILIGGELVAEAKSLQPRDVVEALSRPPELRVPVRIRAGEEVDVRVEFRPDQRFVTMRLGITAHRTDAELLEQAVTAAAAADVAVVVVGSAEGQESEGFDRDGMALAGAQDELVRGVAAANRSTVVVVNSGMPVLMPWIDDVAAVIQAWLPGQAFGEALAEVLAGDAEPGGRLPLSIPRAEADSPVLHARPDNGTLAYGEGLLVGYRGFDRRGIQPLFPFGHGDGYTEWDYEAIEVAGGAEPEVAVRVRNAGGRAGGEIVQVYLEPPVDDPQRPVRTLAGFARVTAEPGEAVLARVGLGARSFACFDMTGGEWVTRPGTYTVRAGRSSRDLRLEARVEVRPPTSG
jgi:beta-glucosidase